jgi:hypothetical protein
MKAESTLHPEARSGTQKLSFADPRISKDLCAFFDRHHFPPGFCKLTGAGILYQMFQNNKRAVGFYSW